MQSLMAHVKKYDPSGQFATMEHCDINELLNMPQDSQYSIARASVAPGVMTQLHCVENTLERYVLLEGKGRVYIDHGPPEAVAYLDVVTIAPGMAQKIENTGTSELVFLCICTPRFEQKNYRNLEA